jgi:hypothetical protein
MVETPCEASRKQRQLGTGRHAAFAPLMRIAAHHTSEVGVRAGRIILGERELLEMGVVDRDAKTTDTRIRRSDDLLGFDVVMTDDPQPAPIVERALRAGISCVLWVDGDDMIDRYGADFAANERTLLVGANLAAGLAPSLAVHESLGKEVVLEVSIGWTEPGRALRRGEPVVFPDPVGGMWAAEREPRAGFLSYAAPTGGEWAGAMAKVTLATPEGVATRIVGVADLAVHLEALALAAGAITIGAYASGGQTPAAAADRYLDAMIAAGLDVATHTMTES